MYIQKCRGFLKKKNINKERTNNHTMFLIRVCKKKTKVKYWDQITNVQTIRNYHLHKCNLALL